MPKVVVVGSLNMDIVASVAAHPRVGETVAGQGLSYFPGGKGANQAIACHRMGAAVEMVGRVGADAFGAELLALQRAEGIDTQHLAVVEGEPTGVALIAVAADSSNTIIVNAGANAAWHEGDLAAVTFEAGDILLTQCETPLWVVEAMLRKAGDAGAVRILNPSPVSAFDNRLLPLCDIVVLNEIELAAIAGADVSPVDEDAIVSASGHLIAAGCLQVVVTLGAAGARLCSFAGMTAVEGRRVAAVDSTGAGDCFTGALATGLLGGLSLEDAAHFANIAASISVTRAGASPSMPTLAEVEAIR